MVDRLSPLGPARRPGRHGNAAGGAGVVLSERRPGSIVEAAAWRGEEARLIAAIAEATGLALPDGAGAGVCREDGSAFGIAPGRFLLAAREEGLAARLAAALPLEIGTVTDLSHGRTALAVSGERAEWVLAKLFAIDFALEAFPVGAGRSTAHHEIHAQIQRRGDGAFDLYVFRSFARSFWHALEQAAAETGYVVE